MYSVKERLFVCTERFGSNFSIRIQNRQAPIACRFGNFPYAISIKWEKYNSGRFESLVVIARG